MAALFCLTGCCLLKKESDAGGFPSDFRFNGSVGSNLFKALAGSLGGGWGWLPFEELDPNRSVRVWDRFLCKDFSLILLKSNQYRNNCVKKLTQINSVI